MDKKGEYDPLIKLQRKTISNIYGHKNLILLLQELHTQCPKLMYQKVTETFLVTHVRSLEVATLSEQRKKLTRLKNQQLSLDL